MIPDDFRRFFSRHSCEKLRNNDLHQKFTSMIWSSGKCRSNNFSNDTKLQRDTKCDSNTNAVKSREIYLSLETEYCFLSNPEESARQQCSKERDILVNELCGDMPFFPALINCSLCDRSHRYDYERIISHDISHGLVRTWETRICRREGLSGIKRKQS